MGFLYLLIITIGYSEIKMKVVMMSKHRTILKISKTLD